MSGWIGVDMDGTLAHYNGWRGISHVGTPVRSMVKRVKQWLDEGKEVRIFTARVSPVSLAANETKREDVVSPIEDWCKRWLGAVLPVTHEKDFGMVELWDDRCVQVIPNTGDRADKERLPCKWHCDHGQWESECKMSFNFECEGPKDNGFKYCPNCGGPVEETK